MNSGPSDAPAYILRQTAPPFTQDPSGEPMTVKGNSFFQIVMMGASGVDLSGSTPNMTYTGPKTINANLPTLLQLVEQGDFEATLSWIFGLNHNACPTVTVLQSPLRLVLDFPA
ncbi:MAG TPA: hypothetical protein VI541_00255 [Actinomycetota bacterium]|nr:hypothetical protein [Actinomycetota bacterium]